MVEQLLVEAGRRASPHAPERAPVGARPRPGTVPIGLLVPHAGLVYSGVVAATGWRLLREPSAAQPAAAPAADGPLTVVILGTNHGAAWLDGIGVWDAGAWNTPLGEVAVDSKLGAVVLELGRPFTIDRRAHLGEHSIEVQLPLLRVVHPGARILPLAVAAGAGTTAVDAGVRLGARLGERRAVGDRIILVISSDMAHYPPAAECEAVTEALVPSILSLDAFGLAAREASLRHAGIRGVGCGMCGIEPAVVGLSALRAMGVKTATPVASATSADAGGPPDRTVGYLAVRFDG